MYLLFIGSFHTKTTSSKIVHSWCEFKSVAIVFERLSLSLCAHPNLPLYTQIWFSVLFNRESYDWILFQLHTIPLYGLKSGERKSVNLNKIFSFHYEWLRASARQLLRSVNAGTIWVELRKYLAMELRMMPQRKNNERTKSIFFNTM